MTVNLDVFQRTHFTWASENFGDHPWWHPVLGVIEELGEASRDMGDRDKFLDAASDAMIYATDACTCMGRKLSSLWHESFEVEPKSGRVLSEIQGALAHHVLKSIQGIRGSQSQHQAHVWMYLCQMTRWLREQCDRLGVDLRKEMKRTFDEVVARRNWKQNPDRAHEVSDG